MTIRAGMTRECPEDKAIISNAEETTFYNGVAVISNGSLSVNGEDKKVDTTGEGGAFDTKAKKLIIISISVYSFIMTSAYSMLAPFFPGEASKKDTKSAMVGLIFAIFPLVIILLSPLIALVIPMLGTKFTLSLGLILEGGSQIIFGFVHLMPTSETFVAYSLVIRIFSGVGAAATSTASLTLLSQTFKDNIASAMGIKELFSGIGLMAGPPIGGFLYAASGFQLPFLLIGIIAILSLIPLYFVLPPDKIQKYSIESGGRSLLSLLKLPSVLLIAVAIVMGGVALSFLDPTLEPHLEKPFHLTSSQVGLMFLVGPAAYAIAAPPVGMLANKWSKRMLIIIGTVVCGLAYILLGPAPFLPAKAFPSTLWLNGISLAVFGIGGAMFCIPALPDMNDSALKYGLEDSIATQSALSSIYNSMFYIGGILGPVLAGVLVEHLEFPWSSAMFGFMLCFSGLVIGIFTCFETRNKRFFQSRSRISNKANSENEEICLIKT